MRQADRQGTVENIPRPGGINHLDLKTRLMAQGIVLQPKAAFPALRDIDVSICERLCFFKRTFRFLKMAYPTQPRRGKGSMIAEGDKFRDVLRGCIRIEQRCDALLTGKGKRLLRPFMPAHIG